METEELINGDVGKSMLKKLVWSSDVDHSAFWLLIFLSVSLFST